MLPGPTLVLMLLLMIPYLIFLAGGQRRRSPARFIGAVAVSASLMSLVALILAGPVTPNG